MAIREYIIPVTDEAVEAVKEKLNAMPREVVRCKDCKFYLNSSEKCALIDTRLNFYETDKRWTEEDYCSWGERWSDNETY